MPAAPATSISKFHEYQLTTLGRTTIGYVAGTASAKAILAGRAVGREVLG